LPSESAFLASIAALCFQVALRLSRLDFEVFFLGTAIGLRSANWTAFLLYNHCLTASVAEVKVREKSPVLEFGELLALRDFVRDYSQYLLVGESDFQEWLDLPYWEAESDFGEWLDLPY
jgi:hypothetical protein